MLLLCISITGRVKQRILQVQNAQQAGAIAAIIYDDTFEPLIIMSKPLGHPDPAIPAVFVAQKTGIVMQKFLRTGTVTVQIIQVRISIVPAQTLCCCVTLTVTHSSAGNLPSCSNLAIFRSFTDFKVLLQVTDAVWVSMLMSALAGILAVCLMIATFYCIR